MGALLIVSGQTGTVRRDRANTEENPELSVDAKLSSQIENLEADVRGRREETRAGFESLSKQIAELNANGSRPRTRPEVEHRPVSGAGTAAAAARFHAVPHGRTA